MTVPIPQQQPIKPKQQCSLCDSLDLNALKHQNVPQKSYFHCQNCDLIFMEEKDQVSLEAEKARYKDHQNFEDNEGYVQFLQKLVKPLTGILRSSDFSFNSNRLTKNLSELKALDYGCGPQPVLGKLFSGLGLTVENFDPYFFPREFLETDKWELILSTEVWEHFRQPKKEIAKQLQFLKTSGILGIMTHFHQGANHFSDWWYVRDLTHVVFYSQKTIQWIATQFQLKILYESNPVVIFQTKAAVLAQSWRVQ